MNYVAATLLSYLEDEELTFVVFMSLIVHKRLLPLWFRDVPEYHLRNFILDQLIKRRVPRLHAHFQKLNLNLEMLTSTWVMTLFCGYFPSKVLLPFLDNFFREGWTAVYRFALSLLILWEEEFVKLNDIAFISRLVHQLREDFTFDKDQLFSLAYSREINSLFGKNYCEVIALEKEFFFNQVKVKLGQRKSTWTQAEKKLLPVLMSKLEKREMPIKKEIMAHQKKIRSMEVEVNKAFQSVQALRGDYTQSRDMYEVSAEKASVLDQTLTSLKRELHTQKQTYKMKLLSVVLKKRATLFHLNQR